MSSTNLHKFNPIDTWLGSVAYSKSGSKSTERNYRSQFSRFLSFVGKTADEILAEHEAIKDYNDFRRFSVTIADYIKAWILSLRQEGLTNSSVNVMVGAVQSFFMYNRIDIGFIPTAQRHVVFHNRDITREEIADIMNTSLPRDRAFYAVMAQSGLRPDTICKLKLKHVEYDRLKREKSPAKIDVPEEIAKGKYRSYFTFISFEAIQALNHYLKTRTGLTKDSYLFVKLGTKNRSMSPVAFSAQFNKTARMLREKGILDFEVKENKPSEIRLYNLRKFFKKHTHEAGEEFSEFWMGHKGKGVIDHYRTRDPEFHRKLYAEKAAPYLRIELKTPSETEKQIEELRRQLDERDKQLKEVTLTIEKLKPLLDFVEFTKKEELDAYMMELESAKSTQKGIFVFSKKDPNVAKKVFALDDSYLIKNPLRKKTAKNSE